MRASKGAIDLIKEFEGFKAEAYLCPAGIPTIGYGSTRVHGMKVTLGMKCTVEEAEGYLMDEIDEFTPMLNRIISFEMSQEQFDAICSFVYNLGIGNFQKSTLLKKINVKDYNGAADEFLKWNKAGGKVLPGLTRRREAERNLFLTSSVSAFVADSLPT